MKFLLLFYLNTLLCLSEEPSVKSLIEWNRLMVAAQNKNFIISKQKEAYDPSVVHEETEKIKDGFAKLELLGSVEEVHLEVQLEDLKSKSDWYAKVASLVPSLADEYGVYLYQEMLGLMTVINRHDFDPKKKYIVTMRLPVRESTLLKRKIINDPAITLRDKEKTTSKKTKPSIERDE